MRTPEPFRSKAISQAPGTHQCQNPDCGCEFRHRPRGGNRFCSNKCRWGLTPNARQALHRLTSRREFIEHSVGALLGLALVLQAGQLVQLRGATKFGDTSKAWTDYWHLRARTTL